MKTVFIGEPISVERQDDLPGRPPLAFTWRGERHPVARVEATWHDAGFGPLRYPKRWWQRRHRTYFQVTTAGGRMYELYLERPQRGWFLYRQLLPED